MKRGFKVITLAVIALLIVLGYAVYSLIPSLLDDLESKHWTETQSLIERMAILEVSFKTTENAVFLRCILYHGVNGACSSNLTQAIIMNNQGEIVTTALPVPTELLLNEKTVVRINLNSTLASGDYTLILITSQGGSFVSTFTV